MASSLRRSFSCGETVLLESRAAALLFVASFSRLGSLRLLLFSLDFLPRQVTPPHHALVHRLPYTNDEALLPLPLRLFLLNSMSSSPFVPFPSFVLGRRLLTSIDAVWPFREHVCTSPCPFLTLSRLSEDEEKVIEWRSRQCHLFSGCFDGALECWGRIRERGLWSGTLSVRTRSFLFFLPSFLLFFRPSSPSKLSLSRQKNAY